MDRRQLCWLQPSFCKLNGSEKKSLSSSEMASMRALLCQSLLLIAISQCYGDEAHCTLPKVWRKLNGPLPVCFKAEANGHVEFESYFGINMRKLKYVRRSGFHECEYGHGGYFGCEAYAYHDGHGSHHPHSSHGGAYGAYGGSYSYDEGSQQDSTQKDSAQKDSAQKDSVQQDSVQSHPGQDPDADYSQNPGPMYMHQISVFLCDEQDNVLYPQPPFQKPYFIEPSINRPAWDYCITLTIHDCPIEIFAGQKLRLYHGEDLYSMGTEDNTGTLCVDVYAYGDLVYPLSAAP